MNGCRIALLLVVIGLFAPCARAAQRQVLLGHVPAAVTGLTPSGRLPVSQSMNLAIALPLRNTEALAGLLKDLYDPASPLYHQFLTPEQFTERFGPAVEDYAALAAFAKSNGLEVTATHPNRALLDVKGSVADVEKLFHVSMRVYPHPTEARTFFSPDVEPSVDAPVQILRISGMDSYWLPHPMHHSVPADRARNAAPNAGSGPSGSYRGYDFRKAYAPGVTLDGAGQKVGLLQFDGYYSNDIAAYVS